jgi:hypothetical protein
MARRDDALALIVAELDSQRLDPRAFLRVPGKWLAACGYGDADRVLPVLKVDVRSDWWTFATVDASSIGGLSRWVVHVPCRGATFQSAPESIEADATRCPHADWYDTSAELR